MMDNKNEDSLTYKDKLDFYSRDYEMKVDYLKDHLSRLWTRFNFFLSIELALFGFLGYLLFDGDGKNIEATLFPILLGSLISVIWCFVGWQDRALVKMYQRGVRDASINIYSMKGLRWYKGKEVGAKRKTKGIIKYCAYLSITKIPFLLGALTLINWLIMFFMRNSQMPPFIK